MLDTNTLLAYVRAVTTRWNRRTGRPNNAREFPRPMAALVDYMRMVDQHGGHVQTTAQAPEVASPAAPAEAPVMAAPATAPEAAPIMPPPPMAPEAASSGRDSEPQPAPPPARQPASLEAAVQAQAEKTMATKEPEDWLEG